MLKFQEKFLEKAFSEWCRLAVLSIPRGNAKSWLAAKAAVRSMDPLHPWYAGDGKEVVLVAGSIPQARAVFGQFREMIEASGSADSYRWKDSERSLACLHKETRTRFRVLSSLGRGSMGLVGVRLAICDEPACWKPSDGELLYRAITTAQAKPSSPLRVLFIGTEAPAHPNSFWPRLIASGTSRKEGRYVQTLAMDPKKFHEWSEVRRVNPLVCGIKETNKILRQKWMQAKRDPAEKAAFLSYHGNCPTGDAISELLSVSDWEAVLDRKAAERDGDYILGFDLGQGRAWSCAFAYWPDTRLCDAIAMAPGSPALADQERRDAVPTGCYQALEDGGALFVSPGRVPAAGELLEMALDRWGQPGHIIADRFRIAELEDAMDQAGLGSEIEPRRTRWSESSEDIRAFRKAALDNGLSVHPEARLLLTASMTAARIATDDAGGMRLRKRANNVARDDAIAAGILAIGAAARMSEAPELLAFAV